MKNVYPVPMRMIVPNSSAPFSLNKVLGRADVYRQDIQVGHIVDNRPELPLVAVHGDKVEVDAVSQRGQHLQNDQGNHQLVYAVDVLRAKSTVVECQLAEHLILGFAQRVDPDDGTQCEEERNVEVQLRFRSVAGRQIGMDVLLDDRSLKRRSEPAPHAARLPSNRRLLGRCIRALCS